VSRGFEPDAAGVAAAVTRLLDRHGRCTIVDVHSYPSVRLPYERHDGPWPPLCVGTDAIHTPPRLRELVVEAAAAHGLANAFDTPFARSYVPLERYGHDPRVSSVMLETRRDIYLDEATATPHAGERRVAAMVDDVVARIVRSAR
jgi:N-formylglutamate deformylase